MLTDRELSTIRAALRYWADELVPHGAAAMRPYFAADRGRPLSAAEVRELIARLETAALRYAVYDPTSERLVRATLVRRQPRLPAASGHVIAAVLIR